MPRATAGLAVLLMSCAQALPAKRAPIHEKPPAPLPVAASSVGVSRPPTSAENEVIRELMKQTEQLRSLRFRAPVTVRIQDKVAVRAYVETALDEQELLKARRRYVALGLLDPNLDVRELIESLMEEELIGYYDPKQKMLALREEVASSLARPERRAEDDQWRATVVHELVHALQDQHLGLSEAMHRERTTDAENAFGAVVEGDATLAMLGYMATLQGSSLDAVVAAPDQLAIALRSGRVQPEGKLARAPAIVREPLLFRYRDGALFAAQLFARGGWQLVDDAHRAPPESTSNVRDPRSYLEHRVTRALPRPPDLSQHNCSAIDDDALGSLELSTALGADAADIDALARAWRGDRYLVLQCEGHDASVWSMRFATAQAAQRARAAVEHLDRNKHQQRLVALRGTQLLVALSVPSVAAADLTAALTELSAP